MRSPKQTSWRLLCPLKADIIISPRVCPLRLMLVVLGVLVVFLSSPATCSASSLYCGTTNWSSIGPNAKFLAGPCLGVSGIGATQTPQKTILIIDRSDCVNTHITTDSLKLAYAEELNLTDKIQRGLDVLTDTFCSTGQFAPDGAFLTIGGPATKGAGYSIRQFYAGGVFTVPARMTSVRWYPTSQLLPDGRVVVVGGSKTGAGLNTWIRNNPSLEYYPRKPKEGKYHVPLLDITLPYNFYPFVHLLPSGRLFIFAASSYVLWDTQINKQVGSIVTLDIPGFAFSNPLSGTSVMFPLTSRNNFTAEIMICGGGSPSCKPPKSNTAYGSSGVGNPSAPAHQQCHRIQPESANRTWVHHNMTVPRVLLTSVLLPDGNVLLIGGAKTGCSGIPNSATKPANVPELYDTRVFSTVKVSLPASKVPRVYHSSAFLLHNGTVFLSGSNPNCGTKVGMGMGSTNFRTEFFFPPYFKDISSIPVVLDAPSFIQVNTTFHVIIKATLGSFRVVLCHPGFSTHGANHGMRNIELTIKTITTQTPFQRDGQGRFRYNLTIGGPLSLNVAPPTFYWLFVLADGQPNTNGFPVYVTGT